MKKLNENQTSQIIGGGNDNWYCEREYRLVELGLWDLVDWDFLAWCQDNDL